MESAKPDADGPTGIVGQILDGVEKVLDGGFDAAENVIDALNGESAPGQETMGPPGAPPGGTWQNEPSACGKACCDITDCCDEWCNPDSCPCWYLCCLGCCTCCTSKMVYTAPNGTKYKCGKREYAAIRDKSKAHS